jgi:hypothetical protein
MSPSVPNTVLLANLQAAQQNISALIADITANPKPTYNVDGQNVDWTTYLSTLIEKSKNLNELIQVAGGNFELQTTMLPGGGGNSGVGGGIPGIW